MRAAGWAGAKRLFVGALDPDKHRRSQRRRRVAARGRRRMLAIFADGGGRDRGPGDLAAGRLVPGRLCHAGIAGERLGQRRGSRHRSRAAEGGKAGDEGQKREEMPGHCPVT